MKKKTESSDISLNSCEHCGRNFVRASTLLKHVCEQKRRWDLREAPGSRIGYAAWNQFYTTLQPSKKQKDYRTFIGSPYYAAFVQFGTYCCDVGVINVPEYIRYLLKNNTPIDNWTSDRVYTVYLMDYIKTEDPYDAVKRSAEFMLKIARDENIELRDVLRYVRPNKLCQHITAGRISPWVLYLSDSGAQFLSSLNDDQRSVVWDFIDTERWNIKFKRNYDVVEDLKLLIAQLEL